MAPRPVVGLVITLLVLVALPAFPQTVTGTVQGTVTDASGAALPGVTVTIRNMETGLERTLVTNERGFFNAPFLPIGRYRVTAELGGLGSMARQNVPVGLNQTTVQDFVLTPAVSETITVSADAPRINVTDGEIKQTMRSDEIMAIPSPQQNSFLHLASTFSGYSEPPAAYRGSQDNPTLSVGSSVNFNGAGTRGTTFQINGVNNDDSSENQHRQGVALATIKSFQVLSNSFSAEFGRGYGAVVLVQTKSGTNDLAGEIYGYAQDAQYNELPHFQKHLEKPNRYRRQYGFTAGFPIVQDTLFAFVNADRLEAKGHSLVTRSILTQQDLALPRLTLGNDTPENRAWQNSIIARFPNVTPNDPRSPRFYQYPQFLDHPDADYSGRLDWIVGASNTLTGRYQRSNQIRNNGELIIGEQTLQDNRQSNFGLTWTSVLSADTVQEARYGLGLRSTNVNIAAGNDTPILRFIGISFGTIMGNAGAFPINRDQSDHQLVYNLSSARWERHTLRVGTDLRRSQLNDHADNFTRGFWIFRAACGGVNYPSAIHAFMAGCVNQYWKGYGPASLENSMSEANVYAQDDWRPRDNLTVNLGVRYEYVSAPEEEQDRVDYLYSGSSYVDPRLGFAYTPNWERNRFFRALTGGNGRFSIRGGYGHYHGRVFQSIFSQGGANVRFNPPNAIFKVFSNSTNLADPTGGFVFTPGQPPAGRVSLTLIDPELKMPETRQWNLTFERQVMTQARLRVSYIGTLGKNLLQYRLDNLPIRPDDPNSKYRVAADWQCAGTGSPGAPKNATCPNAVPIAADEISLRFPRINERRPDARYGTNLTVANLAESSYHAGQLEFETGNIRGFQGRMTYTYGKAMDTGSEATFSGAGDINIFPESDSFKRGLSRFDVRHRFTMTGSYLLPFFRDRRDLLGSVLGGWQIATVVRLSSGTPFTIVDNGAQDIDFDGVSNRRPVCVDPQYCGGWHVNDPNTSQSEMPREAFRSPVYGDRLEDLIGRNTYFTDGAERIDLSLSKGFGLPMNDRVIVRLDVFNVLDRITWGFPINDINNKNFGKIISTAYDARSFQLGLRYVY